ncbi:fluoride efflux transporter CrcB [Saccharothrix violaceirubra]|uniref:Fluoride-specific ion channel FluC n=1 Tax=Saccharothrix violaceirubra TaxID=413306 RepID=A0A7W7T751_9PSEU|nr:CrcB family protein [Saccharothrix violaceirubra]MBB4967791.1 CrcB protein [Saccharothrix violaceirubra]
MIPLLVFAGAAVGTPVRYLVGRLLNRRFPAGTLAVNVVGSFLLGCLTAVPPAWYALLGTGFCGGLTTYSTFGMETVALLETRDHRRAALSVGLNLALAITAATLGHVLTR